MLLPRQQTKLARGAKDKEHAMSQIPKTAIAVIGIDIGKNSFHIVSHDERGAIVLRQKWSRGQVEAACTDSATLFNTFAVLCTQHRWCGVPGKTSSSAFQKPSAPSPTAISGVIFNPRLFTSMRSSRQLCARFPECQPGSR